MMENDVEIPNNDGIRMEEDLQVVGRPDLEVLLHQWMRWDRVLKSDYALIILYRIDF